jgi:formyl-CoA transferase
MSGTPPLSGIRVLEIGNYMASPFCGLQLADLGAEVIKIEAPDGGDQVRSTGPLVNGEGSAFVRLNRNKRSLALDLKSARGRDLFLDLVERTDIVLENLRPGAMAKAGLDYARLGERNPGLIYVAFSGWGQDGPLAGLPGLDLMAQAHSGLMSITGDATGGPTRIGVPICDLVCALYGALAAVSALRAREITGKGQYVDVCLLEAAVSLSIWGAGWYFATGEIPQRHGSSQQSMAPYQSIRSSDGSFTVGATTPKTWSGLCRAMGLEQLEADPRFRDTTSRFANREPLIAAIERTSVTRPTEHWIRTLRNAGVPCASIQDYGEVYSDPHLLSRGYFWDAPHPKLGMVRQLGSPMRLSETPVRKGRAGPMLGEDSEAILAELGMDAPTIAGLIEDGVIARPAQKAAAASSGAVAR